MAGILDILQIYSSTGAINGIEMLMNCRECISMVYKKIQMIYKYIFWYMIVFAMA